MNTQFDASSSFYLDSNSLSSLKMQAKQNQPDSIKAAAKQFESVFLSMMLKSMRDATPQDGVFDNEQTKMYTSMLDQQLAQTMSKKGMGLAEIMTRQLSGQGLQQHVDPIPMGNPLPKNSPAAAVVPALKPLVQPMPLLPSQSAGQQKQAQASTNTFVDEMMPHARAASQDSGIPARFMVGQAALESGWGKHEITGSNGKKSFNLFGIKAGKGWKGDSVSSVTTEYENGKAKKVVQSFRAYQSYDEAFRDYARLISGQDRYQGAAQAQNAAQFAQGLQAGGYATDPAYAKKLLGVLNNDALNVVG